MFDFFFDKRDLPVRLQPGEKYNFIYFVEYKASGDPARLLELGQLPPHFHTRYTITWNSPELSGPVNLQQSLTWKRPRLDVIMCSCRVRSPVVLNKTFTVQATVSNYDSVDHTFSVVVLPTTHPFVKQRSENKTLDHSDWGTTSSVNYEDDESLVSSTSAHAMSASHHSMGPGASGGYASPSQHASRPPSSGMWRYAESRGSMSISSEKGLFRGKEEELEGSLLCLDSCVALGTMRPQQSRSATLHFLALREGVLDLNNIFLLETNTDTYYRLERSPSVFAIHAHRL